MFHLLPRVIRARCHNARDYKHLKLCGLGSLFRLLDERWIWLVRNVSQTLDCRMLGTLLSRLVR
jgi:hypothetical protein